MGIMMKLLRQRFDRQWEGMTFAGRLTIHTGTNMGRENTKHSNATISRNQLACMEFSGKGVFALGQRGYAQITQASSHRAHTLKLGWHPCCCSPVARPTAHLVRHALYPHPKELATSNRKSCHLVQRL